MDDDQPTSHHHSTDDQPTSHHHSTDDDLPTSHHYSADGVSIPTRELRYLLTSLLGQLGETSTAAELVAAVGRLDIAIAGRRSKTVSDALRAEVARGRVVRVGWGRYRYGRMQPSTARYVRARARRSVAIYAGRAQRLAAA